MEDPPLTAPWNGEMCRGVRCGHALGAASWCGGRAAMHRASPTLGLHGGGGVAHGFCHHLSFR